MNHGRFYRSTREAFPAERFPAVFGPYRRKSRLASLGTVLIWVASVLMLVGMVYAPAIWRVFE